MRHSVSILVILLLVCAEVWKEHIYSLFEEFGNRLVVSHRIDQLHHKEFYLSLGNV